MASIQKRGSSYLIIVSKGRTPDGKVRRETTTWKPSPGMTARQTKKALNAYAREFEEKVKKGQYLPGEKMTLYHFSEIWMKEYVSVNLAPNTQTQVRQILDRWVLPQFGSFLMTDITPMHITSLYNQMTANGLAPSSVQRYHHILSSLFHTAQKWMVIPTNPCESAIVPKITKKREIQFFTEEETKRFLEAMSQVLRLKVNGKNGEYVRRYQLSLQERLLFTVAVYGGLRRGEITALTWEDVNFSEGKVSITKEAAYTSGKGVYVKEPKTVSSNRVVSLPSQVMDLFRLLKREREETLPDVPFVFIQANGQMMHPDTPSKSFKRFLSLYNQSVEDDDLLTKEEKRKQKLPMISIHGLRHTSATLLLSLGTDPVTVANRLGHASPSTTLNVYAHALESKDKEAGDALADLLGDH